MPSVTLITSLPTFASPEEHANIIGSTPASFSDIPPVLKHHELNVSVRLDPPIEGFANRDAESGQLYVLTSVLVFMSTTGRGFQINYPDITLHAISRAGENPAIYCQLEAGPALDAGMEGDEELDTELQELSIIPQSSASLESIFESLSYCAALHPDPHAIDDDDDDGFFDGDLSPFETFIGDEQEELNQVGRAALEHLESIIYDPQNLTGIDGEDGEEDNVNEDADAVEDAEEEVEVKVEEHPLTKNTNGGEKKL